LAEVYRLAVILAICVVFKANDTSQLAIPQEAPLLAFEKI